MNRKAKRVFTCLAFASVLLLAACSYTTSFVIVNETEQPLEVKYVIAASPSDPLSRLGGPALTAGTNLGEGDKGWRMLKPDEYEFDREARSVKVRLSPHEALLIKRQTNYRGHDKVDAASFAIEEITLRGAKGEMIFRGDETRRSFIEADETLYTLNYK